MFISGLNSRDSLDGLPANVGLNFRCGDDLNEPTASDAEIAVGATRPKIAFASIVNVTWFFLRPSMGSTRPAEAGTRTETFVKAKMLAVMYNASSCKSASQSTRVIEPFGSQDSQDCCAMRTQVVDLPENLGNFSTTISPADIGIVGVNLTQSEVSFKLLGMY